MRAGAAWAAPAEARPPNLRRGCAAADAGGIRRGTCRRGPVATPTAWAGRMGVGCDGAAAGGRGTTACGRGRRPGGSRGDGRARSPKAEHRAVAGGRPSRGCRNPCADRVAAADRAELRRAGTAAATARAPAVAIHGRGVHHGGGCRRASGHVLRNGEAAVVSRGMPAPGNAKRGGRPRRGGRGRPLCRRAGAPAICHVEGVRGRQDVSWGHDQLPGVAGEATGQAGRHMPGIARRSRRRGRGGDGRVSAHGPRAPA